MKIGIIALTVCANEIGTLRMLIWDDTLDKRRIMASGTIQRTNSRRVTRDI